MLRVRFLSGLLAVFVLAACRVAPQQQLAATPELASPSIAANMPTAPVEITSSPDASAALGSTTTTTPTDALVFVPMTQPGEATATSETATPELPATTAVSPTNTPAPSVSPSAAPSTSPSAEPTEAPVPSEEASPSEPSPSEPSSSPSDAPSPPVVAATPSDALTESPAPSDASPAASPSPSDSMSPAPSESASPSAEPSPPASAVSGEKSLARGTITTRPWAVMIDNQIDAWPQSGLNEASLVFEALAEGGITRFMAVFDGNTPAQAPAIGPVRSARAYFVQWAMGLEAIFMHAGGSPDALALAATSDRVVDIDALVQQQYTARDSQRVAPHNLYTNADALRTFAAEQNRPITDTQIGYLFDRIAPAQPPQVTAINYTFTDPTYRAGWLYNAETNGYYRSMSDTPHVDQVTGAQLWTRNVVVIEVPDAPRPGDDQGRLDLNVVGSGTARVFMAGQQIDATWRKDDPAAPLRFFDAQNQEIVFNVGPMWVAAVSSLTQLTVQ